MDAQVSRCSTFTERHPSDILIPSRKISPWDWSDFLQDNKSLSSNIHRLRWPTPQIFWDEVPVVKLLGIEPIKTFIKEKSGVICI